MKPIIFRITGMSYEVHKTLTKNKSKDQPYCDLSFSADGDLLGTSQKNGVISGEYLSFYIEGCVFPVFVSMLPHAEFGK